MVPFIVSAWLRFDSKIRKKERNFCSFRAPTSSVFSWEYAHTYILSHVFQSERTESFHLSKHGHRRVPAHPNCSSCPLNGRQGGNWAGDSVPTAFLLSCLSLWQYQRGLVVLPRSVITKPQRPCILRVKLVLFVNDSSFINLSLGATRHFHNNT